MEGGWDFHALEDRDGLRFTWNEWPATQTEAAKAVVPIACMYTPFKNLEQLPRPLEYEPVRCKQPKCNSVLNPYCLTLAAADYTELQKKPADSFYEGLVSALTRVTESKPWGVLTAPPPPGPGGAVPPPSPPELPWPRLVDPSTGRGTPCNLSTFPTARDILDAQAALPSLFILWQRYARRANGLDAARAVFAQARKSPFLTSAVYLAAAQQEWFSNRSLHVARNILDAGRRKYPRDISFLLSAVDLLTAVDDSASVRSFFESILSSPELPVSDSRPLWDRYIDYELRRCSGGGSLAAVAALEGRRAAALQYLLAPEMRLISRLQHRWMALDSMPTTRADNGLLRRFPFAPFSVIHLNPADPRAATGATSYLSPAAKLLSVQPTAVPPGRRAVDGLFPQVPCSWSTPLTHIGPAFTEPRGTGAVAGVTAASASQAVAAAEAERRKAEAVAREAQAAAEAARKELETLKLTAAANSAAAESAQASLRGLQTEKVALLAQMQSERELLQAQVLALRAPVPVPAFLSGLLARLPALDPSLPPPDAGLLDRALQSLGIAGGMNGTVSPSAAAGAAAMGGLAAPAGSSLPLVSAPAPAVATAAGGAGAPPVASDAYLRGLAAAAHYSGQKRREPLAGYANGMSAAGAAAAVAGSMPSLVGAAPAPAYAGAYGSQAGLVGAPPMFPPPAAGAGAGAAGAGGMGMEGMYAGMAGQAPPAGQGPLLGSAPPPPAASAAAGTTDLKRRRV